MKNEWICLYSKDGPELVLFKTRFDWMKNPRNGKEFKAVVLESPDWVDIVAMTPQKEIIVAWQYRFGIGRKTVEIPAGIIAKGETPEQAAIRELREETGYMSNTWKYLGWIETNPAFMNNICHQWLALDVVKTDDVDLDESEAITIDRYTLDEVRQAIVSGRMRNAFTLLALSRVFDLREIWVE